jgi:predicted DNA-binding transcriptional regulator AlpA
MVVKIFRKSRPDAVTIWEKTPDGMVKRLVKKTAAKKVPARRLKPKAPEISLSQPGRLRVANLMSLFGVSRTTLYAGVNVGRYPKHDGKDGRLPYWNTETIQAWLAGKQS